MKSSEVIQNGIVDDAIVVSPGVPSPFLHFVTEILSRDISVSVLVKITSLIRIAILTATVADHASTHCLLRLRMPVLMVSVVRRTVLVPFGEVHLTVTIARWWRTALIVVVTLIIFLQAFKIILRKITRGK